MSENRLKTGETMTEFKARKGTDYDVQAARYAKISDLIQELVMRHRGDISEQFAQALGDEANKRIAALEEDRAMLEWCIIKGKLPELVSIDEQGDIWRISPLPKAYPTFRAAIDAAMEATT